MPPAIWDFSGPLPAPDSEEEAAYRHSLTRFFADPDHHEHRLASAEDSQQRLLAAGRTPLWAYGEWCLATRLAVIGRYPEAEPRITTALAKAKPETAGLPYLNLLNLRGIVRKHTGDYAGAISTHRAMLEVVETHNLHGYGMPGLTNLAFTLMEMGCAHQAAAVLDQHRDFVQSVDLRAQQVYWASWMTCADAIGDPAKGREALQELDQLREQVAAAGKEDDPTALAALRVMGPLARLPNDPTSEQILEAGCNLLNAALQETRFMPGYRLKAAVSCARLALQLRNDSLALQLVELGRQIRPADLPVGWARELEDLAAEVHEARGELREALDCIRRARGLESSRAHASLDSAVSALLRMVDGSRDHLRAVELEEVNQALRSTTERLDAALVEARSARQRAENAAADRHRFLSRMSHELRTPLQGVLGTIELLHDTHLSDDQRRLLEVLDHSARFTLGIVDDILEVGRLEQGGLEIRSDPFVVEEVLRETLATVQTRARSHNTTVGYTLPTELPPVVLGDRRRLGQVLLNLVSNAVKYTSDGRVDLQVRSHGSRVEFAVRDTGCGIDPDDLATIFDPYVRTRRTEDMAVEGAGLGLAIAYGIVQAMNGTLTAQSTPGEGSIFTLTVALPAAAAKPDEAATVRIEPARTLEGTRVLLAEDNAVSQMVLRRHLSALGARHHIVADGRAALAAARSQHFDVLILDFHMPLLGGLEVSRQLRSEGITVPIIGLTASALPEDEEAARAAHMNAYATKPVSRSRLKTLILSLITR